MLMSSKIMAAYHAGMMHGALGKPAAPSTVHPAAACVAAYMKGWAKGWAACVKYSIAPVAMGC